MTTRNLKLIRSYLADENLDGFLVLTKVNRQYLSGFTGSQGVLLVTARDARLYVDSRYTLRVKKESLLPSSPLAILRQDMLRAKTKRVGVEDSVSVREFLELKKLLIGITLLSRTDVVESLRAIKSKGEIKLLKQASQIVDETFRVVQRLCRGRTAKSYTEQQISFLIEKYGRSRGAEGLSFDPIVAFGPNAAAPHHLSSNKKIGKNNFLLLDFGMKIKGLHSDFTRTLFLGRPSKFQELAYNAVFKAQKRALAAVLPGTGAQTVDRVCRRTLAEFKLDKFFTHNAGHGVGLEIHESPNFSPQSPDILRKNMVVTVEPGVYLPGKFGIRVEDMVLVEDAPKVFSKIPKDFRSMIIP